MAGLNGAYGDGFVGVANYGRESANYIKGDNYTDGSVRLILDSTGMIIRAEKRVAGIWIPADLEHSTSTWLVDDDLGEFVLDELGELVYEG